MEVGCGNMFATSISSCDLFCFNENGFVQFLVSMLLYSITCHVYFILFVSLFSHMKMKFCGDHVLEFAYQPLFF